MRSPVRMLLAVGAAVVAGELADLWARRRPAVTASGPVAIVVLGFPGHRRLGRSIQRLRTRMAVRALGRHPGARIVLSGGVTFGAESEAVQMAAIARSLGVPDDRLVLEDRSRTTWENVAYTRPLLHDDETVVLVSDGVHAARARRYWRRQFPQDIGRVTIDPTYRPLEGAWMKFPSAVAQFARPTIGRLVVDRHRVERDA